jgi:hypothetical protein
MTSSVLDSLRFMRGAGVGALVGMSFTACVWAQGSTARTTDPARDTSAFALVLRTVATDTALDISERPLHVDPRPLRNDRQVWEVSFRDFAPVSGEELEARKRVLVVLGLVADDADLSGNCAGTLSPPVPGVDAYKGCPSRERTVVAVGWPRRGDALAPAHATPDSNRWTVRVLVSSIGPTGYNVQSLDYVLEHARARWTFVGKKTVGWVE